MVVLRNDRRRADFPQVALRDRYRVFQIFPLGFGRSDRPKPPRPETLPDQILAVLDEHDVERFVVWGYSQCAAFAACVARATPRVAGLVCGGLAPGAISPAVLRRLDRMLPEGHQSRPFWRLFASVDWVAELAEMRFPRLLYFGSHDRQMAAAMRRARDVLEPHGVDFLELDGLGHAIDDATLSTVVVPSVADWIDRRIGRTW